MTIFSFFIFAVIFVVFLLNQTYKNQFISMLAFYVFVYMNIEVGYFYKTKDDYYVRYSYVVETFVLIMSLFLIIQNIRKIERKIFGKMILTLMAVLAGAIHLLLFPLQKLIVTADMLPDQFWLKGTSLKYPSFDENVIKSLVQYLIFVVILFSIYISFERKDYLSFLKKTCNWCKVSIVIGYIEFILKNIFGSNILMYIINDIFGFNKNVLVSLEMRGAFYRLSGLTTEASHYAYVLFIICIVFYTGIQFEFIKKHWLILSVLIMALTMAFSSILFLCALIVGYLVLKFKKYFSVNKKFFRVLVAFLILTVVVVVIANTDWFGGTYFGERLKEIVEDKALLTSIEGVRSLQYSSSRVRIISMLTTLQLVLYRPFFGIGLGVNSAHGSTALILSDIGIVGTAGWLLFLFYGRKENEQMAYKTAYFLLIAIWLMIGFLNSHFLGMLYNSENYLLAFSFFLLCNKETDVKKECRV